jgi:predicted RND superfamily exporter protein
MWAWLANKVLRNRVAVLIAVAVVTILMGMQAGRVGMSYKQAGLLPRTDSAYVQYQEFLRQFSEDGNVIVVGVEGGTLYTPENFRAWYDLGRDLRTVNGVDSVFSEAHLFELVREDDPPRFTVRRVMEAPPTDQAGMDALVAKVRSLPFYDGLLYNDSTQASLMMVFVNAPLFNSDARLQAVNQIAGHVEKFRRATGVTTHVSGLPWIRVQTTELVKAEMPLFMGASLFLCGLLLLLFFRSWRVTWISLGVVAMSVVWSFGFMHLMGYEITILQSVIAPLVIVTGVPNCVFLINAYHYEYVRHRNKVKALQRVISRVGAAAFLTNATTAVGFTTFCLTKSDTLIEFGWVATFGIMVLWLLSMLLIPVLFSFFPPPKPRHLSHLDRRWLDRSVEWIVRISHTRRPLIYSITALLLVVACFGILRMKDESRIVDDLPADSTVLTDLQFFERNFRGVMPLEVVIDTQKKGGALRDATLKRIERLEDTLATYPQFSRPISIAGAVKFTKQAFYGGSPDRYALLNSAEKPFILPYVEGAGAKQSMARAFIDSTRAVTRVTVQMADVGTTRMDELLARLRQQVDGIFPPENYLVTFTGTCVVFLKGSGYLVENLITSLFWAVVIIMSLMALLFSSLRIMIVAMIPNMIPLLLTAGIMGFVGIPIKPSTMLVFGIALGIAVDNAIHFLARYRLELQLSNNDLEASVDRATREVSVGIIYTSAVLLAGFGLFAFSHFGGIKAMGVLTTITLCVAMLTNLLVLPSLVLSLNKRIMAKQFGGPLLEILDEEDELSMMELKLEAPEEAPDAARDEAAESDRP